MNRKNIPFVVLALLVYGCNPPVTSNDGGTSTEQRAQAVTDVVKRQDLVGYSFFDGKLVIPDKAKASAFSPYDTPVLSVSTGEGKYVDAGEPIVKLTIPGAEALAASAKAAMNSAQTSYSQQASTESGPVIQAKRELEDAKKAESEAKETVANGGQADVEMATQMRIGAQAALKQAQADLGKTLQPTKDAVNQAAQTLAAARADAAKGIVRAPISGTVVKFKAEPGMMANAKQELAEIVNFNLVRVQGLVPAELKDVVIKDSKVIVAMSGPSADPLDGKVLDVTVAPPVQGQKAPGYLAVIELSNPKSLATPNIAVKRIGVKTGTAKDVLVVPVGAIIMKDGKSTVDVKSGDSWISTEVETGISDGALIAVKTGLKEGDTIRVITANTPTKP